MKNSTTNRSHIVFAIILHIGIGGNVYSADDPTGSGDSVSEKTSQVEKSYFAATSPSGAFQVVCDTTRLFRNPGGIYSEDTPTGGTSEIKLKNIVSKK